MMVGTWGPFNILSLVEKMCKFMLKFEGEIPGATSRECGNYLEHNLEEAKKVTKRYLLEIYEDFHCVYPMQQ